MVIRPTDIVNWEGQGRRLEAEIDARLKAKWDGAGLVRFPLPQHLPDRIVKHLIQLYTDAGWVVSHSKGDCQKEGSWNHLDFREKTSNSHYNFRRAIPDSIRAKRCKVCGGFSPCANHQ